MSTHPPEGWYDDPTGRHANRYWDGSQWSDAVSSGRSNATDPLGSGDVLAPPAPGTETHGVAAPEQPAAVHVTTEGGRSGGGSLTGFVLGALAVVVALVILIAIISNSDDGGDTPTTTIEAPATTAAGG